MAETIKLDPSAEATGRIELDLTPFVSSEGVDWGDATIEQYLADSRVGSDPVDFRVPNRRVQVPLKLQPRGTVTFEQIRRQLQAKAALFQREGGWLSRVTNGGTAYAEVVNATLRLGGGWAAAYRDYDVDASLELECMPDWYGAEITLDDQTETTALALTKVFKLSASDAVIAGDYPGRVRIVVDEDQGQTQLGLLWGFRSRYYDSATTAALAYEAEALTPLDSAAVATSVIGGASGGASNNVVYHTSVSATDWTPVLSTQIVSGSAHLTHKGSYRVWARVACALQTRLRFVWQVAELVRPVENAPFTIPVTSNWYLADLGEIRLDAAPAGTHRWLGMLQAQMTTEGATGLEVDALLFQPLDESAGQLSAPQLTAPGDAPYLARDDFSQASGNLTGGNVAITGATNASPIVITATAHGLSNGQKVWIEGVLGNSASNGYWTVASATANTFALSGSTGNGAYTSGGTVAKPGKVLLKGGDWHGTGNATDATINTTDHTARRTVVSDGTGRNFIAPGVGSVSAVAAQMSLKTTNPQPSSGGLPRPGVLVRYVDQSNWLYASLNWGTGDMILRCIKNVAGSLQFLDASSQVPLKKTVEWVTVRIAVDTAGRVLVWLGYTKGGNNLGSPVMAGQDDDLATGGVLATGRVGFRDLYPPGDAATRDFDDFAVWTPTFNAVLNASRSAQLTTAGMFRQDTSGVAYSKVGAVTGDLPRMPVSGLESRKVELFLKASRGDLDNLPDLGIDDLSARAFYRPSWLILPGS